jgi:hypothetical protein
MEAWSHELTGVGCRKKNDLPKEIYEGEKGMMELTPIAVKRLGVGSKELTCALSASIGLIYAQKGTLALKELKRSGGKA